MFTCGEWGCDSAEISKIWIIYHFYVTNAMEQSPSWEANSFSASQEITHIIRNTKVHSRVSQSPQLVPILGQIYPFHTLPTDFFTIHCNIFPPSTSAISQLLLSFSCTLQDPLFISSPPHTCHMSHTSHTLFDHRNNICCRVQIMSSSLRTFLHFPLASSILGPNISLGAQFFGIILCTKGKQSCTGLLQTHILPGVWGSQISKQSVHEGGNVSPLHWSPLPPRKYSWYSFLSEAESTTGT